jgi:hypothetical protein
VARKKIRKEPERYFESESVRVSEKYNRDFLKIIERFSQKDS